MKGIILAGGLGTRLYPTTKSVNKHLLPIYDKPMIYYPLATLMSAGIRNVIIVQRPEEHDSGAFEHLFGDGSRLGMTIHYTVQPIPTGIAGVFHLSAISDYLQDDPCCLILGDNIFYGHGLPTLLNDSEEYRSAHASIFGYQVTDPERYGVLVYEPVHEKGMKVCRRICDIEEKPKEPKSNYAVPGIYYYGPGVCLMADLINKSKRGEYEITDLHRIYLRKGLLQVRIMPRGIAWLDTGTPRAMQQASSYVQAVQDRQGQMIACPEEIAYRNGWVTKARLKDGLRGYSNEYRDYVLSATGRK